MASKITFGKLDSMGAGNGGYIAVLLDGAEIGEIVRNDESVWNGMSRRYEVGSYELRNDEGDVVGMWRVSEALPASKALQAAKAAARALAA